MYSNLVCYSYDYKFVCLIPVKDIDRPTNYHYFSQPSWFFAQSNKVNNRDMTVWLHKKMPFYIFQFLVRIPQCSEV